MATNPPIHHNMTIHARLNPNRAYVVGLQMPEVRPCAPEVNSG